MDRERLEKQLRRHESYRKHAYRDSEGVLTIAYGRNLDHNGISRLEARLMLRNDIETAQEECLHRSPITYLDTARDHEVPVFIGQGIRDSFVSTREGARAFNQLANQDNKRRTTTIMRIA